MEPCRLPLLFLTLSSLFGQSPPTFNVKSIPMPSGAVISVPMALSSNGIATGFGLNGLISDNVQLVATWIYQNGALQIIGSNQAQFLTMGVNASGQVVGLNGSALVLVRSAPGSRAPGGNE